MLLVYNAIDTEEYQRRLSVVDAKRQSGAPQDGFLIGPLVAFLLKMDLTSLSAPSLPYTGKGTVSTSRLLVTAVLRMICRG